MANKIQELTEKLYEEGLQKGKAESERMIGEAEQRSKDIIREAQKKAADILAQAEKDARELSENTLKELSLASGQALADLRQSAKDLFVKAAVGQPVAEAFKNETFIQELILSIVRDWAAKGDFNAAIQVPEDKKQAVAGFVQASVRENLGKELPLEGIPGLKNGFRIARDNGRYYINFTDKEFDSFFRAYIRPRVASILFGEE